MTGFSFNSGVWIHVMVSFLQDRKYWAIVSVFLIADSTVSCTISAFTHWCPGNETCLHKSADIICVPSLSLSIALSFSFKGSFWRKVCATAIGRELAKESSFCGCKHVQFEGCDWTRGYFCLQSRGITVPSAFLDRQWEAHAGTLAGPQ